MLGLCVSMESGCSLWVAGWPLSMDGMAILVMLGEYGPVQFVEFTKRSRAYVPRPGGAPERRALYVHYMDTVSVDYAAASWKYGGLSEKYVEASEGDANGARATLYVSLAQSQPRGAHRVSCCTMLQEPAAGAHHKS